MNTDENVLRDSEFEYESEISNPLLPPEIPDDYEAEVPQEKVIIQEYRKAQEFQNLKDSETSNEKEQQQREAELQQFLHQNSKTIDHLQKIAHNAGLKNLD